MTRVNYRQILVTAALLLGLSVSVHAQDTNVPPNSLVINDNGNVGVGLANPASKLHVAAESAQLRVDSSGTTASERVPFQLTNNGKTRFAITNGGQTWTFDNDGTAFNISKVGTFQNELRLSQTGNLNIRGVLFENSSRTTKEAITLVDPAEVLDKVVSLPIAEWQYRDGDGSRHLGPMAEDFHATFQLGHDQRKLATLDTSGVALAAIQGLHRQLRDKDSEIAALVSDNDRKAQQINTLEARLDRLEALLLGQQGLVQY